AFFGFRPMNAEMGAKPHFFFNNRNTTIDSIATTVVEQAAIDDLKVDAGMVEAVGASMTPNVATGQVDDSTQIVISMVFVPKQLHEVQRPSSDPKARSADNPILQ